MDEHRPTSTLEDVHPVSAGPLRHVLRKVGLGALTVVVLLGAAGLLGVRSGTATGNGEGYRLTVTYPRIARAGLDVPWRVRVQHPGGFGKEITLAVTADYFTLFESQGFVPEPSSETRDGDLAYLTFAAPPGDQFAVDFDAYIQPASQLGKRADVLLVIDGRTVARTAYRTWLVP